jgi:hypothetical protein
LNHPNICTIYDIDEHEGRPSFIAMEYLEGSAKTAKAMIRGAVLTAALIMTKLMATGPCGAPGPRILGQNEGDRAWDRL